MLLMDAMSNALRVEERLCNTATQKRIPLGGSLELLPLCNMNCDMCYVRLGREEMEQKGRIRSGEEWLELANQMRDAGTLFILLTGGEPLLHPDFRRIYCELKKMGMIVTVNSNGTLIDEEWADFFAEYRPRRLNITLYGKDAGSYERLCHFGAGYERTVKGIRLLRERGVDVKINGSLTKENRRDIPQLLETAKQLDAPIHIDTYMYPAGRERKSGFHYDTRLGPEEAARARVKILKSSLTEDEFRVYGEEILNMVKSSSLEDPDLSVRCRAGRSSFIINWLGNMTPCVMLNEPSINAFEKGFIQSWNQIINKTEEIRTSEKCGKCTLREVCNTCAACALLETGSYDGVPDYICRYTQKTVQLLEESRSVAVKAKSIKSERSKVEPPDNFVDIVNALENRLITEKEAIKQSGMTEAIFYRRLQEYRKNCGKNV